MEINELKVGDWVKRKNVPGEYLVVLSIDGIKNTVYLNFDGMVIMEKIENLESVDISSEIIKTHYNMTNSKLKNNPTIWLCVDGDGNEYIADEKPIRWIEHPNNNLYHEWWTRGDEDDIIIEIPRGTIKRLIGKELTWDDEPFKLDKYSLI